MDSHRKDMSDTELNELKEKYDYVLRGAKVALRHIDLLKEILNDVTKSVSFAKAQVDSELDERGSDFTNDYNTKELRS